ncbi:hypothetical protein K435DRAFT_702327, partial [Dendrothele bispora CBS 962.96]
TFASIRFSSDDPLTFDEIPWPVLHSPKKLSINDITWRSVEDFFNYVRSSQEQEDYKKIVYASRLQFHTDKWVSRLNTVKDKATRDAIEKGMFCTRPILVYVA